MSQRRWWSIVAEGKTLTLWEETCVIRWTSRLDIFVRLEEHSVSILVRSSANDVGEIRLQCLHALFADCGQSGMSSCRTGSLSPVTFFREDLQLFPGSYTSTGSAPRSRRNPLVLKSAANPSAACTSQQQQHRLHALVCHNAPIYHKLFHVTDLVANRVLFVADHHVARRTDGRQRKLALVRLLTPGCGAMTLRQYTDTVTPGTKRSWFTHPSSPGFHKFPLHVFTSLGFYPQSVFL